MAMSYLARPTVVLDTGSGDVKAGFSGEDCPTVEFRPLVGRYRHSRTSVTVPGLGNHSSLVGETVHQYRSALSVTNVLEAANVPNYLNMEQILAHSFDLLDVDPSQHSVLLSDLGTVPAKEVTCQVMFETFQSPSLHLEHPAVLSLYGSGRCTGLVFLSGEGTTLLYPVYEGFTISTGVSRHSVTGGDLTNNLQKLLQARSDLTPANFRDLGLVREMKERVCSVAMDYRQETEVNIFTRSYRLPDGQIIKVGNERFLCPEAFFQPSLLGKEDPGVHQTLYNSIQSCDLDVRRSLYSNIIMSGGSTLFPGFSDRLMKEMSELTPRLLKPKIHNIPWRKYLVWTGGSIYSSISSYKAGFVSKEEYEEHGLRVIHNRRRKVEWNWGAD